MKPTPLSPDVQLIEFQQRGIADIVSAYENGHIGVVLRGGTGIGKMYMKALTIRTMLEKDMLNVPEGSVWPFPVLWLAPKSVKEQTKEVIQKCGIAHVVQVMSYGEIKASVGTAIFLDYITVLLPGGQPHIKPVWKPMFVPALLVCDEMQKLKNITSMITSVVTECPQRVKWLGASATPWQRVADARCTLIRCGAVCRPYNNFPAKDNNVAQILAAIASPRHPNDYSPSSVQRLRDTLDPYIVEMKNVRFKFATKTVFKEVGFRNAEQAAAYADAHGEYVREMAKKGKSGGTGLLVAIAKFKEKAEFLRYQQMAETAFEAATKQNKQVLIGVNYLNTARGIWTHIVKVLHVSPAKIAFIVGGQTEKARQQQVTNFQTGVADYIVVTTTSGGVGISLHHDRASTKPRHVVIPLPWSAIDLVQFLGRGHRLTSQSATTQEIIAIANTVETSRVVPKLKLKVKCISKSVTAKEQFCTLFEDAERPDEEAKAIDEEIAEEVETERHVGEVEKEDEASDDTDSITGEGLSNQEDDEAMPTTYR